MSIKLDQVTPFLNIISSSRVATVRSTLQYLENFLQGCSRTSQGHDLALGTPGTRAQTVLTWYNTTVGVLNYGFPLKVSSPYFLVLRPIDCCYEETKVCLIFYS